ncbi:hypothetical protein [Nonomuraea sp. NPDC049141]|uniref:hypothetical protein n=1 Tax=Nonomuraea sp. NPDC049141 TaxID=3155500 RepID=UPI0033F9E497
MEYLIVALAALTLILVVNASLDGAMARRALFVLLLAFAIRLVVHVLVLRPGLIEYGGDNHGYEGDAMEIVRLWRLEGIHFVTADESPYMQSVAVPCNVFALIMYVCGGLAPLACTAFVALLACVLCVIMYRLARVVGATEQGAFRLLVVVAFMPALLLHTADTYKDGFSAFLVVACVGIGVSLSQRFALSKLLLSGGLLWCLWHVRPYMVFMCAVPLVLGMAVSKTRLSVRRLFALSALLATGMLVFVGAYDNTLIEEGQQQLDQGQSTVVRSGNADGGSGIEFTDGGSAWSALGPKLLYTVLSPFPWSSGSLTLQMGKIDVLLWYFLLFSAVRGAGRLWHHDRHTLLQLLAFIVPSIIVYATTMANVGLILRQRIPIELITSLLAAVVWSRLSQAGSPSESPGDDSSAAPDQAAKPLTPQRLP